MGLFLKQNDDRTELQTKLAAELQQRLNSKKDIKTTLPPPAIDQDRHFTKSGGIILAAAILIIIFLVAWLLRP